MASQYVAGSGGLVALADVGQRLGIGEDVEGFLDFGQVVKVDQHDDRTTVLGGRHPLVVVPYAVDEVIEVFTDLM